MTRHDDEHGASPILRLPPAEIALIAWRARRSIALAAAVPPVLALAAALVLPPRYEATAAVLLKTGREYMPREEGPVNGQSAPQTTKQEDLDSEIEIMGSRAVAEDAIGRIGLATMYPAIAASPPTDETPLDAAVETFGRRLRITPVKISDVIDVSLRARTPALATRALEAFLAAYDQRHLAVFGGGDLGRAYETVIGRDEAELERLEAVRAAIKLGNGLYDVPQQQQSLIGERADATEALDRDTARAATLATRIATLRAAGAATAPLAVSTETDRGDGGGAADSALVDLERSRSELLARYAPDHPLVRAVDGQIADLEARAPALARAFVHVHHEPSPLLLQVQGELVVDEAELAPLAGQNDRTRRDIAGFDAELARIERADTHLRTVGDRIDSITENLKITRAALEKARTLDALDHARAQSVSVVQAPVASHRKVFPSGLLFAAVGIVLGLAAAVVALGIAVTVAEGYLTADALERALGARVLATIGPAGAVPGLF